MTVYVTQNSLKHAFLIALIQISFLRYSILPDIFSSSELSRFLHFHLFYVYACDAQRIPQIEDTYGISVKKTSIFL